LSATFTFWPNVGGSRWDAEKLIESVTLQIAAFSIDVNEKYSGSDELLGRAGGARLGLPEHAVVLDDTSG
jgi:hypothetical protein